MAKTPISTDPVQLASCVETLQEAILILQDELAEQAGQIDRLCQANACIVTALHHAWGLLDKITGRAPAAIKFPTPHVHQWQFVCPAIFIDSDRDPVGEGITERCDCGARRSRATCWQVGTELKA